MIVEKIECEKDTFFLDLVLEKGALVERSHSNFYGKTKEWQLKKRGNGNFERRFSFNCFFFCFLK